MVLFFILGTGEGSHLLFGSQEIFTYISNDDLNRVISVVTRDPRILESFDLEGNSPLHRAADRGRFDIVEYLLSRDADVNRPNSREQSPLFTAVVGQQLQICEALIRRGGRLNARDFWGWTPLHYAAYIGNPQIVKLLLDRGADPLARNIEGGWMPLHAAVYQKNLPAVRLLARCPGSLNADAKGQGGPLHWAVRRGFGEGVRLLLEEGADIEQLDAAGNPVFLAAVELGDLEMVQLLAGSNARTDRPNAVNQRSALHIASIKNYPRILAFLLDRGLSWDSRDHEGKTPMDWAQKLSHRGIVKLLKAAGARKLPRGPLHLTHVANTGFILGTSSCRKVMIDCPLNIDPYSDPQLYWRMKRMIEGNKFYQDIDLVLITSHRSDHFDPRLTGDFLRHNPNAFLIGPSALLNDLELYDPDTRELDGRIFTLAPGPGQTMDITTQGLKIQTLGIGDFSGSGDPNHRTLGYLFDLDGWKVLHLGGLESDEALAGLLDRLTPPPAGVDILFIPQEILRKTQNRSLIDRVIHPRYLVPTCPDPRNLDPSPGTQIPEMDSTRVSFRELFTTTSLFPQGWFEPSLPPRFDWRELGIMTPVKDQKDFHACGAFAAVGVMEALIKKATGETVDLSEQDIINGSGDWESCGISSIHALKYLRDYGVVLERGLPYRNRKTRTRRGDLPDYQLTDFHYAYVDKCSLGDRVRALKNAVFRFGPVATNMMGYQDFMEGYSGGIYEYDGKSKNQGSHIVVVVGWVDDPRLRNGGYWICRNSWGTDWGEGGYFRIAFGEARIDDFWFGYGIYQP